jgi:hypothetical protein
MIYRTTDRKQATWLYKRGYIGLDITDAAAGTLFVFDIPDDKKPSFERALRDYSQGKL